MKQSWLSVLSCGLVIAGCRGAGPFEGGEFEAVRDRAALPFILKLNEISVAAAPAAAPAPAAAAAVERRRAASGETLVAFAAQEEGIEEEESAGEGEGFTIVGIEPPAIADRKAELRDSIKESLERYNVVSLVTYDDHPLALEPDLELTVVVSYPRGKVLGDVSVEGVRWVPNLFLWLLGGFPGWIIEDTRVDQGIEIKYVTRRPGVESSATDRFESILLQDRVDISAENVLNFYEKASWWQYIQQIVIPPFLVYPDEGRADASLYENYVRRAQMDVARSLKEKLPRSFIIKDRPLVLVTSPRDAGEPAESLRLVVFSENEVAGRIDVARITSSGEQKEVFSGELEPILEEPDWRSLFPDLGDDSELLEGYDNKYRLNKRANELRNFGPADGEFLRFTVEFLRAGGGVRKETWTVAY